MIIGVPKEIKNHEYRVGLVPAVVQELVIAGHEVYVEHDAGVGIGIEDHEYQQAGAKIAKDGTEIFNKAKMIVKVKEPQAVERARLTQDHILFTYLHLAPDPEQTRDLIASQAVCIAYETVTDALGRLPLLAPMSEVAGRMSIQAGAFCLEKSRGGRGTLLGGVPGVEAGKVVVIGAGVVGSHAVQIAVGMGAQVVVLDRSLDALRRMDQTYGNRIQTIYSTREAIVNHINQADLVIGGVLIPGAAAPKLIRAEDLKNMLPGSVVVDVAIDQGGCMETSKPTTHQDPTYVVDDIVHYCVANMPGAVARTSTFALNNATFPFVLALANKGATRALREDKHLLQGLNVYQGKVTYQSVADSLGLEYVPPDVALA